MSRAGSSGGNPRCSVQAASVIEPCADHRIVVVQDCELTARDAEHGLGEVE